MKLYSNSNIKNSSRLEKKKTSMACPIFQPKLKRTSLDCEEIE